MTFEGWLEAIDQTATDPVLRDLMAKLLAEQDVAKQVLSDAGFGVTGTPWLDVVSEVAEFAERYR